MKLMTIFFVLIFSVQTFAAQSGNIHELIDNYQYAIEVEWDQQDTAFVENQNVILSNGIQSLIESGATPEELLNEVLSEVKDEHLKNDVLSALTIASQNKLSPQEFEQNLIELMSHTKAQGSSWSTLTKVAIGGVVALVVARVALEVYFYYWGKKFGA